ncbi:transcription/translation regulatory transformer protein RfaH [Pusillimonas sp. 7-48]|uniref:Transcription antitermination protein RfaH n=1 Tax=Pusillimonas minor TaxID=2697024 RepID=A0A842HTQ7_9BURK|nr:transcription/translation regulatory transformer protein RfaH [Pusillimonas minor]
MHWYLIHTKPRQEACALQNLQQQGYTCYLPQLFHEKLQRGKVVVCQEALFPRYLFIQLGDDAMAQSWAPIRSTRGVSRLVTFGTQPKKIDNTLVDALRQQEALHTRPVPLFQPGDRVQITQGPFSGIEGLFQITDGERRAMVLIELLSKPVRVPVMPEALAKAL